MGFIFDQNMARLYDAWTRSGQGRAIERAIEPLVLNLLDPGLGERVLDIGCGTGNHLLMLNRIGLEVSGVDASPQVIDWARKRLGHRSTLKVGLAEDLPFEDNEFDFAVMINTLEFLDRPVDALREAGRVANRKVFIGVMNSFSWNGLLRKIEGYLGDPLFGGAKFYNLWQLKSLLKNAFGHVPLSWGCIKTPPSFLEEMRPFGRPLWHWKDSPFGFFLGISATMAYRIKADSLPLKVRLKEATRSLMGASTFGDIQRRNGAHGDERGLPL
jgi:ubiquinone/menaquinone biosynthesis C-methylase UbiE